MMGSDYLSPPGPSAGLQASVGGGMGNVMNLLDLDLDEPVYEPETVGGGSSSGVEEQLGDLGLGSGGSGGGGGGNYLAGLDFGLSGGNGLLSLGADQGLVQPKQVLLPAKSAQGLEINGTFARRGGKIFLDLTFANKAMQPLFDFAFQFNTNT